MDTIGPFMMDLMGAELVEKPQVRAFRDEIIIHRAKHRAVGVRILDFPGRGGICRRVTQWLASRNVYRPFEQAWHDALTELSGGIAVQGESHDLVGAGRKDAGNKAFVNFLNAENGKRVSMLAGSQCFCFVGRKVIVLLIGVAHGSLLCHGPAFHISFAYWRIVRSEENQPTRAVLRIVRPYQASSSTHKLSTCR